MANEMIFKLLNGNKKEEEINTKELMIKDNLLRFDDLTIQLSNISQIYAGKKQLNIPTWAIVVFLISVLLIFIYPVVGIPVAAILGFYLFYLYQEYQNSKRYLIFQLNSGNNYFLFFKDNYFLEQVRTAVEAAFNHKNIFAEVNIAEQKIIGGDQHIINGNSNNINTGVQSGNVIGSNNQTEQSTIVNKDISGGTIQNAAFAEENTQTIATQLKSNYDWNAIEANLRAVLASLKENSEVKAASEAALQAAEKQDADQFEATICEHRTAFLSDLFINTASGVLAQVVNHILGI